MKIMTIGAGFIADHLPYEQIKDNGNPYRLTPNEEDVDYCLRQSGADVVINCIGRCGTPNIDWCETNKAETYLANVTLPLMIAEWCDSHNVRLIQIGSGCIYFGISPHASQPHHLHDAGWKETDFANPKSFYSKTKYACDLTVGQLPSVTTLRIRMPISDKYTQRNFIHKISRYKQVIDIPNSVTFLSDFTRAVEHVINKDLRGIYHVVNPQSLTAAQVMREYQKYVPDHKFDIINEQQLDQMTTAKRSNCIINGDKLLATGFEMTDSETAMKVCVANYVKNMRRENV